MNIENRLRLDCLHGLRLVKQQIRFALDNKFLFDQTPSGLCIPKGPSHYHTYFFHPQTRDACLIVVGTDNHLDVATDYYPDPLILRLGHPCGEITIATKTGNTIRHGNYFAANIKRFEIINLG